MRGSKYNCSSHKVMKAEKHAAIDKNFGMSVRNMEVLQMHSLRNKAYKFE